MTPGGPALVVFCGVAGVGKTTLSRATADALGATYLRIDTVEAAIASTLTPFSGNPVGYVVAEQVAADQLRGGRAVVADANNGVQVARDGWTALAVAFGLTARFVEVTCRNGAEHRRRVESRRPDLPGQGVPTWEKVCRRAFEPIAEPHLSIDNSGDVMVHVATVLAWLGADRG